MGIKNKVTSVTRQRIADQMQLEKLWYHGRLEEPNFLARLFDLKAMKSTDSRYDNAYDDIYQHVVRNSDWDYDWIYTDPRLNLLHCDDDTYLRFLSMTLHPTVRRADDETNRLLEIYNANLAADGFEIVQTDEISGRPIFTGALRSSGQSHLAAKKVEIKKYLNTDYVNGKVNVMLEAIQKDTDLAIGTAKELLETVSKSILKAKGIAVDANWTPPRLIKETAGSLDFRPKEADDPERAEQSIKQILGCISSIVQGVTELRNPYGTGHGKDADFKGLEAKYAKLLVGVVSEIVIIFLATHGETTEVVEPVTNEFF